jgi:hypothetical protein
MNDYKYLQSKRKIYHSQHGEDGVLEYLFTKIPSNKWSVEFGAWDAKYLSNTFHFIEKHNYNAVLIEGDKDKMSDLEKNTLAYKDKVFNINAFVDSKGENTLDNLLKKTPIPYDFDILSIDIDGQDYNVWDAFTQYKPKVVIVEINVWDKPNVIKVHSRENNEYNIKGSSGTSIKALTLLARKKGYALLANISCNVIFVDEQYLKFFFDKEPEPEDVYTYEVFSLSELNLVEAKRKSTKDFIQKLIRFPYHIFKYGK